MKLRNKKTGEIGRLYFDHQLIDPRTGTYAIVIQHRDKLGYEAFANYFTLAELNEEWEDYKPKEPLLKDYPDEMRAIKAYGHSPLRFHRHARKGYSTFNFCTLYICFNGLFENLKDGETYTITELCGEEEE